MIKFENTDVLGWDHAIRGMRNPLNSWDRTDTDYYKYYDTAGNFPPNIGPNDYDLMKRLRNAGTDHRKFMRMLAVYVDITAPLYWMAEFDTYKVGTVRNSCSFMHKGTSKPFSIRDFSLKDIRIYECLEDIPVKDHNTVYPYETDEYKLYTLDNGRKYKVYRNGKIVSCEFSYVDSWGAGRTRKFPERELNFSEQRGYKIVCLGGRSGRKMSVHRLVAEAWNIHKPEGATQINHIDGNKGNNCVENLEWVTPQQNIDKAHETGLYDNLSSLHRKYEQWKSQIKITGLDRMSMYTDIVNGLSNKQLQDKYNMSPRQCANIVFHFKHSENEELFQECYVWENLIDSLNSLRESYIETKDYQIFQEIRCLLPQGYLVKSTVMLNYEVLANIYKSRKDHKLDEWHEFCDWIKQLPYSEFITGEYKEN